MYVWQLSEELSFKTVAPDIDSAIVNIFNEVVQLCKQHENIYRGVPNVSPLWGALLWHLTRVPIVS